MNQRIDRQYLVDLKSIFSIKIEIVKINLKRRIVRHGHDTARLLTANKLVIFFTYYAVMRKKDNRAVFLRRNMVGTIQGRNEHIARADQVLHIFVVLAVIYSRLAFGNINKVKRTDRVSV